MEYFLDACALIAYVMDEDGADRVGEVISGHQCHVHCINVYELYKDAKRRNGNFLAADELLRDLEELGVRTDYNMASETLREAADLRLARASASAKISIPDVIGLTASRRAGAVFLTADRAEMEPLRDQGFPIEFFR